MRKIKIVGLCLMLLSLTTGCYDYNMEMTVNSDKSVDFSMGIDMDLTSVKDMFGGDENGIGLGDPGEDINLGETTGIDEEAKKDLESRGYTVNTVEEDYKYSVTISKKFANIDDISSNEEVKVDVDKITEKDFKDVFFTAKKGLFKTTYTAYLIFDLTSEDIDDMAAYKEYIDAKYVLNLPKESKSNNATSLSNDGKTLNWELEFGKKNEVIYEFELVSAGTPAMIAGSIIILIAAISVVVVKVIKSKNDIEKKTV